jgi:hypothetical protein
MSFREQGRKTVVGLVAAGLGCRDQPEYGAVYTWTKGGLGAYL